MDTDNAKGPEGPVLLTQVLDHEEMLFKNNTVISYRNNNFHPPRLLCNFGGGNYQDHLSEIILN